MTSDSTTAPEGATTFTTSPDAAILAAFERRAIAFEATRALPRDPLTGGESDEQSVQWAIIDAAEEEMRSTVATTPRGAELQIWLAATYLFDSDKDEPRCYSADLDYFEAQGNKRDWTDRLLIAAMRSLRAMQTPEVDTSAWDAALAEYAPISQRWPQDYDETEALPTKEERAAAYQDFTKRLPGYRAARDKFMAVPAPTLAALAIKMEMADPADDEHHEFCKLDAQRLAGVVA